jgi:hypothetical protein
MIPIHRSIAVFDIQQVQHATTCAPIRNQRHLPPDLLGRGTPTSAHPIGKRTDCAPRSEIGRGTPTF